MVCFYLGMVFSFRYGLFILVCCSFHLGMLFSFGYSVWVFFAILFFIFFKTSWGELYYANEQEKYFKGILGFLLMHH